MSAESQLSPPEHFKGKRWRCWLCGGGFSSGEWTECAVYRGVDARTFATLTVEEGLIRASPKIMPIYVHDRCLDAMDDELAKRIML